MTHNPPSREMQAYAEIMAANARECSSLETEEHKKQSEHRTLSARIRRKLARVF